MGDIQNIFSSGSKFFDFGDEIEFLSTLGSLGANWKQIAGEISTTNSLPELIAHLGEFLGSDGLEGVFTNLDLGGFHERLLDAKERITNLPKDYQSLLSPFDSFVEVQTSEEGGRVGWIDGDDNGEVDITIFDFSEDLDKTTGKLDFSLNVDGNLKLACEAGALWPFAGDNIAPGLLQLSAQAGVESGAKAKLPFKSGSLGTAITSSAGIEMHYFFRPDRPNNFFANEAVEALTHIPNPYDFSSVWRAFSLSQLEGMIQVIDGATDLDVDVAIGKDFEIPDILSAKIAATISVGVQRKAVYQLSLLKAENKSLKVTLSHNKTAIERWSAGLDLEIDAGQILGRVHEILEKGLGKWDKGLEEIKPFLNPGTWIQEKFGQEITALTKDLIKDEAISDAIVHDLQLSLGLTKGSQSELVNEFTRHLTGAISSAENVITSSIQDTKDSVLNDLISRLPALSQDQARTFVEPKIDQMLSQLVSEFEGKAGDLINKHSPKQIGNALKKLGVKVDGTVSSLDDALKGLRNLVKTFDGFLQDVVKKTGDAAKAKLSARLFFESEKIDKVNHEVVGTISEYSNATSNLYRSLVFGKLNAIADLFEPGNQIEGFEIDKDASSIYRFRKVSKTIGYEFVIFGVNISAKEILSGEATVWQVENGEIKVDTTGRFYKELNGPKEGRSLSFMSSYDLLLTRADREGRSPKLQRGVDVNFGASHLDKSLKRHEVTGFLERLVSNKLIKENRKNAAGKIFDNWQSTSGSNERMAGDIAVALKLDGKDTGNLISVILELWKGSGESDGDRKKSILKAERKVFDLAVEAMRTTNEWDQETLDKDFKLIDKLFIFKGAENSLNDRSKLFAVRNEKIYDKRSKYKQYFDDERRLQDKVDACNSLIQLLKIMGEIYSAIPEDRDAADWKKYYQKKEKKLAAQSRDWLLYNREYLFWFKPEMHERTIAFLVAIADISRPVSLHVVAADWRLDDLITISLTRGGSGADAGKVSHV